MRIPEKAIEELKNFIDHDQPFGPIDADVIEEKTIRKLLFDKQNSIYHSFMKRPTIIVGRRGSGKTAFLQSLRDSEDYKITVPLKTYDAFAQTVKSITEISRTGPVYPEAVQSIWDAVLWTALFSKIVDHFTDSTSKNISTLNIYLANVGITSNMTTDMVIDTVLATISERGEGRPVALAAEILRRLKFEKVNFEEAQQAAKQVLKNEKIQAVILMDSIEKYNLNIDEVVHSISGLLKCLGQFNSRRTRAEIRFCLPAEIYFEFVQMSTNPLKDFGARLLLHWHSGDLLKIAAHRYAIYLFLYYPGYYEEIEGYDLEKREGAIAFFQKILPKVITNQAEIEESALTYLLRHTQLLPRQFLSYLNEIHRLNTMSDEQFPDHISGIAIVQGIQNLEGNLVNEIFSAFSFLYPAAREYCEISLPELPRRFTNGDLQRVYTRHVKRFIKDTNRDPIDYRAFRNMLIEIGAIGRVIGETDYYIQGVFEYIVSNKLNISSEDELCIHPIFSGTFPSSLKKSADIQKFVYPLGADPTSVNIRKF